MSCFHCGAPVTRVNDSDSQPSIELLLANVASCFVGALKERQQQQAQLERFAQCLSPFSKRWKRPRVGYLERAGRWSRGQRSMGPFVTP